MEPDKQSQKASRLEGAIEANPDGELLAAATGASGQGADEVTVFLSYAHADEDVYGMMAPFKDLLRHFVYTKSGKKVRAFLDRDSIEWGEYWGERLDAEILAASIFIPMLSASYLDSPNCRLEFNRFQATAKDLGVQELLLPVLVLDAPAIFNGSSTDDIVKEASARQWEVIEEAVLSDPGSSEWKQTMSRLANRFIRSYQIAEAHLATAMETQEESDHGKLDPSFSDDDEVDEFDEPGLADLLPAFEQKTAILTGLAEDMGPAIADLGTAAESAGPLKENPTAKDVQAWTLRSAQAFREPADRISLVGERLFNATKDLDSDMQNLRRIAEKAPAELGLADSYNSMIEGLVGVGAVTENLESLLEQLQPAEYFSAALRKSLRPARRGLTRVTDSIRLIETWQRV